MEMETFTFKPGMSEDEYNKYYLEQRRKENARINGERMAKGGFPIRLLGSSFDKFETPDNGRVKALQKAKDYAGLFMDHSKLPASCLLLCGKPGTGKTHLAAAIALHLSQVFATKYATVSGLARSVRSSYSKLAEKTEEQILEAHISPTLLVLDEVGVGLGSDHERAMMHDVIAGRYDRKKPTILISNLSLPDVKTALGDRIVDRIREDDGMVVECAWESWRGRK